MTKRLTPKHDLHSPRELLKNAQSFLDRGDDASLRGVVLEANAALESWVSSKVFERLRGLAPEKIVDLLKKNTRSLDERISDVMPSAMGRPIDKKSKLWQEYKDARIIRHKVVHEGRRVRAEEAKQVLDAVLNMLAYMESDVGVAVALTRLKTHVERDKVVVESEQHALDLVRGFFINAPVDGRAVFDSGGTMSRINHTREVPGAHPDLFFGFGGKVVAAEVKLYRGSAEGVSRDIGRNLEQIRENAATRLAPVDDWILIAFSEAELPARFDRVYRFEDYNATIAGIHLA